jgi:ribonuclease HII
MPKFGKLFAGLDDATKCPCIGSIFLSGVVADRKTVKLWKELGVKDSKLMTRKKRDQLAPIIQNTAAAYQISEITPDKIDDKSLNLNDWEMLITLQILQKLRADAVFEKVYIDNWETTQKGFFNRLAKLTDISLADQLASKQVILEPSRLAGLEFIAEHDADQKYTVVGAASILSKSASDKQYDDYRQLYGDFGSGNPGDRKTKRFLWQHRHAPLPIIRTSWKTFQYIKILSWPELEKITHPKDKNFHSSFSA